MSTSPQQLKTEAMNFGRYLLSGKIPDTTSVELYIRAHEFRNMECPVSEQKLLDFVRRNRWSCGMIDGALAFSNPNHIVRKKILVMSAVLECRPQHADLFIPQKRNPFYFFVFLWVGFCAVMKAAAGRVLLVLVS